MNPELSDITKAEISLCIFPHLSELVVVDARTGLPGRPRFEILPVQEVFNEEFFSDLEKEFSSLLRKDEAPFLKIMSLPQELEKKIRMNGLRSLLTRIDSDIQSDQTEDMPSVAVLFLTGPFLTLDEDGLRHALGDLFNDQLGGDELEKCIETVIKLAANEREANNGSSSGELTRLIRGDSNHYATLWQRES